MQSRATRPNNSVYVVKHNKISVLLKYYLHLTLSLMDDVAVLSLLVALQVYSPESSGYTDKISSAAKPKSYVVRKR
jgi:hypothetical protein